MSDKVPCACGCEVLIFPLDNYGRSRSYISGHNGRKYDDPTQYKREWNHRNRKKRYLAKKKRHRMLKVKLVKLFDSKCLDCGTTYNGKNAAIFHFHHRLSSEKKFTVGNQLTAKAWKTIREELQKCDMICSFCHATRHSLLLLEKKASDRSIKRRAKSLEKKIALARLFGNKCEFCNRIFTADVSRGFHFHHKKGPEKTFNISGKLEYFPMDKLTAEAKKCVFICSNCHELEHGEHF